MADLLWCEFVKLKRQKRIYLASLTAFLFPVLFSMVGDIDDLESMTTVIREFSGFLLLIPLLAILAAGFFFHEQDHDTLKNLLCIPVSRSRLAIAKLLLLLLFSIAYQATGFLITLLIAILHGVSTQGWVLQLILTLGTGVLLWAAALPCVLLIVWMNKSYLISMIITFFYTIINYVMSISDFIVMQPLGLAPGTLMPVPLIFRWLYQYHIMTGPVGTAFYQRFSPYFAPVTVCFGVLGTEALIFILLLCRIYQRQEI